MKKVSDTIGVRRQCRAVGKDSGVAGSASRPSLVAGPGLVARARHLGVGRSLALRLLADARAHAGRDRLAAVGRKLGVVRGAAEPLLQSSEDACDEASIRPPECVLEEAILPRPPEPAARSGSVTARRSGTPPLWARLLRCRPTKRRDEAATWSSSGGRRGGSTSALCGRMTPALDRVCRGTETAEPPIEAHPEQVQGNDPNPSPHGTNGTRWGEVPAVGQRSATSPEAASEARMSDATVRHRSGPPRRR